MKLISCVHILFVVSPYPVDLVGHHIGPNKAMQQYLVVESLCVPHLYNHSQNPKPWVEKCMAMTDGHFLVPNENMIPLR